MFFMDSHRLKWLSLYYGVLALWLATTAMHIPDGYLSPITCIIMFLIALPFWVIGLRKIRERMNAKNVPLIALLAAFSFVIMMFNFPTPGGTTAHAIGATIAAIILGPESATIVVSIALLIQALFFGDGGITAFGANCFNMAVTVPYISYAIYRAFSKDQPLTSSRRLAGAFVGGWTGVTVAAFFAGVEFGIQPLLFKAADGTPLYAPYPLSVSIPAMIIPHALIASVAEGALAALIVAYLQRSNISVLEAAEKPAVLAESSGMGKLRWSWVALVILIIVSPLGLLAPGTAWGEWGTDQLASLGIKSIPVGMEKLSGLWGAPFADYDLPALGNTNLGYVFSAIVGIIIIAVVVWLFAMLLTSGKKSQKSQN
ncbi:MAG TPA: cobalt transporter CbiM [Anaerolineales bacterium]|nr:cobalt transporter CbiM [Anaerolineales bacterium]